MSYSKRNREKEDDYPEVKPKPKSDELLHKAIRGDPLKPSTTPLLDKKLEEMKKKDGRTNKSSRLR
jgi:hypothetical protein